MHIEDSWYRTFHSAIDTKPLRHEVRNFLETERSAGAFQAQCNSWIDGHDASFSHKLGARGWLGMTWPRRYGGGERSAAERYVVLEELLAAGAPVAAHWFAERQTGPSLLRFGTEEQRESLLPRIARGECFVSIGMSEPDSGSDLASVRTRATRVEGGWSVTGTKIWTSHAQRAHYLVALCRTRERSESRHEGLSQFIIDLHAPGVEIHPIEMMGHEYHFCEVVMDSVFVPDSMLLGREGEGWQQVNAELVFERSGPERFLSTFPLLSEVARLLDEARDRSRDARLGSLITQLSSLRSMSQTVTEQASLGVSSNVEATIVKDLGSRHENLIVDESSLMVPRTLLRDGPTRLDELLSRSILAAPTFTLRGGTTEILRGIIANGLMS
jgi:Acyl-CoA dehydrogenase, middle domain/Acyl-CoA dehydrogenase, N-terminal domain/Acyl-CoA dehydrogenase, C-terminal domain